VSREVRRSHRLDYPKRGRDIAGDAEGQADCSPSTDRLIALIASRLLSCAGTVQDGLVDGARQERAAHGQGGLSMANPVSLKVNGRTVPVNADPDTPLLYVLMNDLALMGPKFGCGLAQCGACSVLADGVEIRSCVTPVSAAQGKDITTLEGLPAWYAEKNHLAQAPDLLPLQEAFIAVQAPQSGYCTSGMLIKASELLAHNPRPSDDDIRQHMNGHLCRCGTYPRIMAAIKQVAQPGTGGAL
jgi:aerobic-type carbon monoxide dehydrogenase small subunit (CoxS/CutS family)